MNGAVIWSCARRCSVIIWCEDGGDLAYAKGGESIAGPDFPEVGDLVALRVADGAQETGAPAAVALHSFRRAEALQVVARGHFAGIGQMMGQGAQAPSDPQPAREAAQRSRLPRLKLLA